MTEDHGSSAKTPIPGDTTADRAAKPSGRERIKAAPGQRLTRKDLRRKVQQRLRPFGWIVYLSGAARYHDDGDSVTAIFRWWHPATWILGLLLLPVCGVVGEPIGDVVPLRVSKYFREHPERLQWL